MTDRLVLCPQENEPAPGHTFLTSNDGPLIITPGAVERFGFGTILACLVRLQALARSRRLDYLQVFEDPATQDRLWFIEDAPGVVTALLPEDY